MPEFNEFIRNLVHVARATWFIFVPLIAVLLFFEAWVSYVRNHYKTTTPWTFLEIKIPREILRGPKAMEQIFSSLHSFISGPDVWYDYYWIGEVKLWYSFEITSFGGDVHFYIKTPTKHKNYVEANIYAQYPDIEIEEVDDYTLRMPSTYEGLGRAGYELWGTELKLEREDVYPIRLYEEFETPSEYSTLDPISSLIEVLNSLRPGEELWIQLLLSPANSSWQERGARFVKEFQKNTRIVIETGDTKKVTVDRSPGEELALKAIEHNISKPGYQTMIRYVYLAPSAIYSKNTPWYGVLGAFNQYSSKAHNSFRHNGMVRTAVLWYYYPFFFPTWRQKYRRDKIYNKFRNREMAESGFFTLLRTKSTISSSHFILNTEELATIYHYPSNIVLTAPSIKRIESRKVSSPAQLPGQGLGEELPEGFKRK
ncbi:MAG: hypothetical protein A2719_01415 [Candidatus Ryanbacteria bacterium RIFCSPHIGHO2_01_FULL_45_22]|uniref:DUF8128 domain-containing protein n=2 Tax=Candidatus Ryaniibacteriota TaxID=1817914 RepID=A0A1G2G1J8_9BACT|nr:MAG: hypothetical protein A2719_01415 [Candidatus Ryanbacteria bacterium RIFCSPHIGHO2_01_FULL_45_22]OGZ46382.1 MAG: hypothetical protein A3J54_04300 [Candidatus Ryanbacteria bacterium RIFCSPHIGHO2_02_FULL_45_13b]